VVAKTFTHNAELVLGGGKYLYHVVLMKVIKSMIIGLEHIDFKVSKFITEEAKYKE
jgi:hypothetical protein